MVYIKDLIYYIFIIFFYKIIVILYFQQLQFFIIIKLLIELLTFLLNYSIINILAKTIQFYSYYINSYYLFKYLIIINFIIHLFK